MMRWALLAIIFSALLHSSPIALSSGERTVNIVPESSYFLESEDEHYDTSNILEHLDRFKPYDGVIYNFGFVTTPIWVSFTVQYDDPESIWMLCLENPHIDRYTLYRVDGGKLIEVGSDGDRVKRNGASESRTFWETLPRNAKNSRFLLHIQTQGSLQVPIVAKPLKEAFRSEASSKMLYGIYYGVLLLLLIYNFVLFVVVRERNYANYLVFLGVYLIFQLNFDGIGREWLWYTDNWMSNEGLAFFIFLSFWAALRFARIFLLLKRYEPKLNRVVHGAEITSFVLAFGTLVAGFHVAILTSAVWSLLMAFLLIFMGFKVLPKYRPARFYLLAWIAFLIATVVLAVNKLGYIPSYPVIFSVQQIASLMQMVLLSFALADRLNFMKQQHLKKLRNSNKQLQHRIQRKVNELRERDRMMVQQSRQAAMGEMIENIAHQWRQPLNQLALIQSNIFFEFQLGKLNEGRMNEFRQQSETLMDYMTKTIDDFRNFFLPDREKAMFDVCHSVERASSLLEPTLKRYHIQVDLSCDGRPRAYGFENEFSQVLVNIINNAKDAILEHKTAAPTIWIDMRREADTTCIEVCDNGGGVDPKIIHRIFDPYFTTKFQSQGTGIGLYMVKTIMEKSMNGAIRVENRNGGACFILTLPREDDHAE